MIQPAGVIVNLASIIDRAVAVAPDRVALVDDGAAVSFGSLATLVGDVASGLVEREIGRGDNVAIVDTAGLDNKMHQGKIVLTSGAYKKEIQVSITVSQPFVGKILRFIAPAGDKKSVPDF